jgi:hypothetical protein
MEKVETLNVALLLPSDVEEKVIALSQKITAQHDAYFVLGRQSPRAHITLYATVFAKERLVDVLTNVRQLAATTASILCHGGEWEHHSGYIGVGLRRTSGLLWCHQRAVQELSLLRQLDAELHLGAECSELQKENIANYGHPDVLTAYQPHITITRFKKEIDAVAISQVMAHGLGDFRTDTIAVARMSDHGTCAEVLNEFALGKSAQREDENLPFNIHF